MILWFCAKLHLVWLACTINPGNWYPDKRSRFRLAWAETTLRYWNHCGAAGCVWVKEHDREFQALRHSQYLSLDAGKICLLLEGTDGCLWAVSDFTCVEVICKQAQASGFYFWMAERCDKTEARQQMKPIIFHSCRMFPEKFSGYADWGQFPVPFWPLGYTPARGRRRGEAGQLCHTQTSVGALEIYFYPAIGFLGMDTGSQVSSPTLSYSLQALQDTEWGSQGLHFKAAPTKSTHDSYCAERTAVCARDVDFLH